MDRLKQITLAIVLVLALFIPNSSGHGNVYVAYDEYGMYIVNETNHFHYCQIGQYYFGVPAYTRSYSYPPANWSCR